MYPLCPACFKLRDEGKIEKCDECNTWHYKNKPCNCKEEPVKKVAKPQPKEAPEPETTFVQKCIICENKSDNYFFCKDCYHKYKSKDLLLKVSKGCTKIELLDESYEGHLICRDGHVVKSKSERDIDNYLFQKNIPHAYEKTLIVNDGDGSVELHPDFYLPQQNAYIEHWGYDESNEEYTKSKKYKLQKYREAGITLICTYEKSDAKDIDSKLDYKLSAFKPGQINFEE